MKMSGMLRSRPSTALAAEKTLRTRKQSRSSLQQRKLHLQVSYTSYLLRSVVGVPVSEQKRRMCVGTSPIDFGSLEQHSVTFQPPEVVAPKSLNSQAASAKVSQSMARPGPSVKAEDLAEVPFAGNIELLAPKKYRCACQSQPVRVACDLGAGTIIFPIAHWSTNVSAGCNSTRMRGWWKCKCLQSS